MFSYFSYGLRIHSSIYLPELLSSQDVEPDLIIREGQTGRSRPMATERGRYFDFAADEAYLFWDEVGAFLVRRGEEVIVEPLCGADEQTVHLLLLGAVLSMVIYQRGLIILHASSVAIDGQAVAFLGASGQGKSTITAALHARGHRFLADDLVVLDGKTSTGVPIMFPSFPQLKLFPEALAASFGDDPEVLPLLMPGFEKRIRFARQGFSPLPVPLSCVYILEIDDNHSIEQLQPQERIVPLIGHSYGAWTFKHWMKRDVWASHLAQCTLVANRVPMYRLRRSGSLSGLSELASRVESHYRETVALQSFVADWEPMSADRTKDLCRV